MIMKVVTSFLALWLLCGGVQGEECVAIDNGYYWDYEDFDEDFSCGCQIQDANGEPVFNVSLDFIDKKTARHEDFDYSYSPCSGNTDCSNETAICRHRILDRLAKDESIGLLNNVTYTVNNATYVNITAQYVGEDGTSVVYLLCNPNDDGTFKFLRRDDSKKIYYFEMSYSGFCITTPPVTTSTSMPTSIPTMTITPETSSTDMSSMTMSLSTSMTTRISTSMTSTTMTPTIVTPTRTPTGTSKPSGNKNEENRKVVLGVVLSILGAIIVGVIMAIIVYYLWKRRQGAKYEQIPSM